MADNQKDFQHNKTGSQTWKPCCLAVHAHMRSGTGPCEAGGARVLDRVGGAINTQHSIFNVRMVHMLRRGPPYFPERNGPERNVPDRKHHLIPRNGPRVKVQLGLSPAAP